MGRPWVLMNQLHSLKLTISHPDEAGGANLVIGQVPMPCLPGAVDVTLVSFWCLKHPKQLLASICMLTSLLSLMGWSHLNSGRPALQHQVITSATLSHRGQRPHWISMRIFILLTLLLTSLLRSHLFAVYVQLPTMPISHTPGIPADKLALVDKDQAFQNSVVIVMGTVQFSDKNGEQAGCAAVDGPVESAVSV